MKRKYESKKEILKMREEIKEEIRELLKETKSDFSLKDVIDAIYNENEMEDFNDIVAMFDDGNWLNYENALDIITDAWNYFPHKILDGKSTVEIAENFKKEKGRETDKMVGMSPEDIFKELYEMSKVRALNAFEKIGGTLEEFSLLEKDLFRERGPEDFYFLDGFILNFFDRHPNLIAESIELFMREYQAMDNHKVVYSEDGRIGSLFLWNVFDVIKHKKVVENLFVPELMVSVFETHFAIDAYAKNKSLDSRSASVAHHVFDWQVMTDPLSIIKRVKEKNVAITYGVTALVNDLMFGEGVYIPVFKELAKVASYKSIQSFANTVHKSFLDIIYEVKDPHMLIIDAEKAPKDWFERLRKVAPKLKDNFEKPDRPVPSPWMYM